MTVATTAIGIMKDGYKNLLPIGIIYYFEK